MIQKLLFTLRFKSFKCPFAIYLEFEIKDLSLKIYIKQRNNNVNLFIKIYKHILFCMVIQSMALQIGNHSLTLKFV